MMFPRAEFANASVILPRDQGSDPGVIKIFSISVCIGLEFNLEHSNIDK
jgi:hypothetical protein